MAYQSAMGMNNECTYAPLSNADAPNVDGQCSDLPDI